MKLSKADVFALVKETLHSLGRKLDQPSTQVQLEFDIRATSRRLTELADCFRNNTEVRLDVAVLKPAFGRPEDLERQP